MDLSKAVHDAATAVVGTGEPTAAEALNEFLRAFIGWPFIIEAGAVRDAHGNQSERFASVIRVETKQDAQGVFAADTVGAVIDVVPTLDPDSLRASYQRIAAVKRLKKSPPPNVPMTTTVTFGIVAAVSAAVPMEDLAQQLHQLNIETLGRERPDMVVVVSTGVIGYAVQFPGEGRDRRLYASR